jgi:hypothetical protein
LRQGFNVGKREALNQRAVLAMADAMSSVAALIFRIPVIGKAWTSSRWWAALLAVGSILVLCLGSAVGLSAVYTNPETGSHFSGLHPIAALAGYFMLIFSIANWPLSPQKQVP